MRATRLALSPLAGEQAPALFELLNDWEVVRMLSDVPWPLRFEDVRSFLESKHAATEDFIVMADAAPIGVMGIKRPGSGEPPRKMPRLGYWIGRRYWGQGYATEAVSMLVERAFQRHPHDRVGAGIFQDNPRSQRVLEKLGFTPAGTKTTPSRSRGADVPAIDMQITRAEWAARRARQT